MNLMNKLMKQQIWTGEYCPDRLSHLATIQKQFDATLRQRQQEGAGKGPIHAQLTTRIRDCKTNLERIHAAAEYYSWYPPQECELAKYKKSDDLASKFRQLGNEFYRHHKFEEALHAYNLSIVLAAQNSELALAFANRSAVFCENSYPTMALKDVSTAEELGYPKDLLPKLEQRRAKCLKQLESIAMGRPKLMELESTSPEDLYLTKEMRRRKEYCDQHLFNLASTNPQIPVALPCVKISENEERGRHVIVTEDVPVGTVLIVDRPFAKILLKEVRWDVHHCHYCHAPVTNGVSCPGCVFAFYCNHSCRDSAWTESHAFECACGPDLYLLKLPRTALHAFRIVCKLGPDTLKKLWTTNKDLLHRESGSLKGFEGSVYNSSSYWPIAQLISHPDKLEPSEIISYSLTALSLVSILETKTNFFHIDGDKCTEFKQFVASVILLHMQNLPPNAHALNELTLPSTLKPPTAEFDISTQMGQREVIRNAVVEEYGAGAFALLSLINHSCSPNVFRVNWWDGRVAVIALQALRAGEELLDNYGAHFAIMDRDTRRAHLRENYYFECDCVACTEDWPTYEGVKNRPEKFVCSTPACGGTLTLTSSPSPAFNCLACSTHFDGSLLNKNLNMKMDQFLLAYSSVVDNDPLAVLESLKDILGYLGQTLRPPFSRTCDAQETFKQALNLVAHFGCFRFLCNSDN